MAAACSLDFCDLPAAHRGWCTKHYSRWHVHGDPAYRITGEVRYGRRICIGCGEDLPVAQFASYRVRCRPCGAGHARQVAGPWVPIVTEIKQCEVCGKDFGANAKKRFACSPLCRIELKKKRGRESTPDREARREANRKWYANNRERAYVAKAAYRARKRAAPHVEMFSREEVFERDGWLCQLCYAPVDKAPIAAHGDRPSLDHIIPLARGGEHTLANAQTAHVRCNSSKGARI